jgi:2-polyprenyl-6-hydroxyphenyl methylase/3-demethylubiquinone-9 3-methyltransferase
VGRPYPGNLNELFTMTHSHAEHNVDPVEIRKFEELAHRWWDPESEFKPLHEINPLRLDYVDRHIALPGKQVLDVGCGGGLLSEGMALRGARVTGIDLGEAPLSVARLHLLESGLEVEYRRISVEALADERPASYDAVTCMEMLEHVPDPSSVVAACAELVRPGGTVCFSTINRNPKSFLFAIVGAEYLLHLLPRGTHEYARFIRPSELEQWTRRSGLQTRDIVGMTYNPLTRVYKLGRDVDVNYIMRLQKAP